MKSVYPACLALLLAQAAAAASVPADRQLKFDVLLGEERIGSHSFEIAALREGQRVRSEAAFDVRVLFVPVYSYRHQATELWRDGCLTVIESQTDANGTPYEVAAQRDGGQYLIRTGSQQMSRDDECLMTFAYWDKRFLQQRELLNSQTGEIVPVEVEPLGTSQLTLAGQARSVDGYRILAPADGVDIRVFYASDSDDWVALESTLENGRVMRYLRQPADRVRSQRQLAEAGRWED